MHKIVTCIMLLLILLLSGCATSAEKQLILLHKAFDDAVAKVGLCNNNMKFNKSAKYVFENIIIDEDNSLSKYQLLSSTQIITDEMQSHLLTYIDENNKCREIATVSLSKAHPYFVKAYIDSNRRVDSLYGRLLAREINIGEFNRLLQEAKSMFEKEMAMAGSKIDSEFLNAHNNELASRERAAAALQNFFNTTATESNAI